MIGGDGRVYEGRGWGKEGSHTPSKNLVSYAATFIGNFMIAEPSDAAIKGKCLYNEISNKDYKTKKLYLFAKGVKSQHLKTVLKRVLRRILNFLPYRL